jgi:hypothetical protein
VWYADSTLRWEWFFDKDLSSPRDGPTVAYNTGVADPAVILEPSALAAYREAFAEFRAGDPRGADLQLALAARLETRRADAFQSDVARVRVDLALDQKDVNRADSLNELQGARLGRSEDYFLLSARIALMRRDPGRARAAAEQCLLLDPGNAEARRLLQSLGTSR